MATERATKKHRMTWRDWVGAIVGLLLAGAILIACGWVMLHQTPVLYGVPS